MNLLEKILRNKNLEVMEVTKLQSDSSICNNDKSPCNPCVTQRLEKVTNKEGCGNDFLSFPVEWLKRFDETTLERLAIMTVDGKLSDDKALRILNDELNVLRVLPKIMATPRFRQARHFAPPNSNF
jgi:hypothetical protein